MDLSICLVDDFVSSFVSASASESSESDSEKLTKVLRFGGAEVELIEMGVSGVAVENGLLLNALVVETDKKETVLGIRVGREEV